MPLKKDSKKRWVEMEYLLPGSPEEVWKVMATGPGYAAWFTRAEIEERAGGEIRFLFTPEIMTKGEVTVWEPPHRFGYVENEWMEGAPPVATEISIEGRRDRQTVVRMSHLIATETEDWDNELESFEGGWPGCFAVLRTYLRHFAGAKAASFQAMVSIPGQDDLGAWKQLTAALGVAGADMGDERSFAAEPEALEGTVEGVIQDRKVRTYLLKLVGPMPGAVLLGTYRAAETANVSVSRFVYGDAAVEQAAMLEPKWRAWLAAQLPNAADEVTWS